MFQHSEMAVRFRPWSCVIVEVLLMHPRLQASNACGWLWPTDNENNSIDEDFYLQLEIYQLSTFNRGARASSCVCVCVDAPFIYSPGGGSALETRDFLHIYTHRTIQTYSLSVLLNPRSAAIACHRYLWIIYALTHKVAIDKLPKWRLGL